MNKKLAWGLGIGALVATGIGVAVYLKMQKNKQAKEAAAQAAQQEALRLKLESQNQFGNPINTSRLDLANIMKDKSWDIAYQQPVNKNTTPIYAVVDDNSFEGQYSDGLDNSMPVDNNLDYLYNSVDENY